MNMSQKSFDRKRLSTSEIESRRKKKVPDQGDYAAHLSYLDPDKLVTSGYLSDVFYSKPKAERFLDVYGPFSSRIDLLQKLFDTIGPLPNNWLVMRNMLQIASDDRVYVQELTKSVIQTYLK
ncbi:MAG: hypothetical protein HY831_02700 [Candidatus Aenigmarchaeota archaeon]|nr:hypothetical protein [Candidatus Aenigmarchaeota archaeon]